MLKCSVLFGPIICFALFSCSQKEHYSTEVEERIKRVEQDVPLGVVEIIGKPKESIEDRMKFYNVTGLSIAVINDFKIEWAKGYGWADSAERRPVTPQTLFQIGSISKSINAMGVLTLMQDGKLDLYTDINNYLVSWKFPYDFLSNGKKITIANLLSHTAGLRRGGGVYDIGDSLPTMIQVLDGKKPSNSPAVRSAFEPGTKAEYSNGGVGITQVIVEDVTHKSYADFITTTIFKPIGMSNSFYYQPPPKDEGHLLATGYSLALEGKYSITPELSAGGLWSTPTDLCKYIIEVQLSRDGRSNKVLSQQNIKTMLTPYLPNVDQGAGFGHFILESGKDSISYFTHLGGLPGFRSCYYGSLQNGKGVAITINCEDDAIFHKIALAVAREYKWKGFYERIMKNLIVLSADELREYVGEYVSDSTVSLVISKHDDKLKVQVTGQDFYDIFPEAKDKFFAQIAKAELEFVRTNNEINKLVYKFRGHSYELKKK